MVKARLRSRVVYSPLESILKKAKDNYLAALNTPVRKKKYGPVFVWELAAVTIKFQLVMLAKKSLIYFITYQLFLKIYFWFKFFISVNFTNQIFFYKQIIFTKNYF